MSISVNELLRLSNPNIIDIRPVLNYNNGHIPLAKNISYNSLLANPSNYLNKSEKYYIYCKKGITSMGLCRLLTNWGYQVYSVDGGYEAWLLNH